MATFKKFAMLWLVICLLGGCARVDFSSKVEPYRTPPKPNYWVLVDTPSETLTVMKDDKPVETFHNIAVGSSGAGIKRRQGDAKTPVGAFRVGWINENSRFNLFFGLDYPNQEYADRAYRTGIINGVTYWTIRQALASGQIPPQDTPLGGFIGIHGVGAGDPLVHASYDWTDGCVALNNSQILSLAKWIDVGTRVEIR